MDRLVTRIGDQPAVPTKIELDFAFGLNKHTFDGLQDIFNQLCDVTDIIGENYDLKQLKQIVDTYAEYDSFMKYWNDLVEMKWMARDIGIETVTKIIQSYRSGMYIDLPLNVGDIVWVDMPMWSVQTGRRPFKITNFMITKNKNHQLKKRYRAALMIAGQTTDQFVDFGVEDIGQIIFMSEHENDKKRKDE